MRYTPATTMVAAWMSAETGVGPAMASGSQVCSGNCPDFDVTPANRANAPISSNVELAAPDRAYSFRWKTLKLVAPAAKNTTMMPMIRPVSPTRLVMNALRAASEFFFSSHQ
jgi:hypothetical protein